MQCISILLVIILRSKFGVNFFATGENTFTNLKETTKRNFNKTENRHWKIRKVSWVAYNGDDENGV